MAMRSFQKLLEGYEKCLVIDLQKNRKDMLFVNIFAVLIAVAMAVPMHFYIPFSTFFTGLENLGHKEGAVWLLRHVCLCRQ